MNLAQLYTAVGDHLNDPGLRRYHVSRVLRALNQAYRDLRQEVLDIDDGLLAVQLTGTYPAQTAETTWATINASITALPLRVIKVIDYTGHTVAERGRRLDYEPYELASPAADTSYLQTLVSGSSAYGTPDRWTFYGQTKVGLRIIPSSTRSLAITSVLAMTDLAADADIPDIPTTWHDLIAMNAALVLRAQADSPNQSLAAVYQDRLRMMKSALGSPAQGGGFSTHLYEEFS